MAKIPFRNNLFAKSFIAITLGLILWLPLFYLFIVPMANRFALQMEEQSGRTILNNVYQMVMQSSKDLKSWERSALEAHKRELHNIILLIRSYIQESQLIMTRENLTLEQTQKRVLESLRNFKYGNNDYIFVSDYDNVLISHPDDNLLNKDFSEVKDVKGNLIVPPIITGARIKGEGFYSYWWHRLDKEEPVEKLTHYRDIAEWDWVIATGVYIDDIREEVQRRKGELVETLRAHLHSTTVAKSGYVFIFDKDGNMIVHPNPNLEGTNIRSMKNPGTDRFIVADLIAASKNLDNHLAYKWDKPNDPGKFVYEKLAWVKYFEEYDWYIASSVYVDELKESGSNLTTRIIVISGIGLVISLLVSFFLVRNLIDPIKQLAQSADRISRGDLTVKTTIRRDDEIGSLARAFDSMVVRLKDHIENLENRVTDRTSELSGWVKQLEIMNQETKIVRSTSDVLQACRTEKEFFPVVTEAIQKLIPESSGALFLLEKASNELRLKIQWGKMPESEGSHYQYDDCWALRLGRIHVKYASTDNAAFCHHVHADNSGLYLCMPIVAHSEILGVLHVRLPEAIKVQSDDNANDPIIRIIGAVAEQAALSLANLRLRNRLQEQSLRDPLTKLFNRRYLEESFLREEKLAIRNKKIIGVIMLDVDYFKRINDTFGHDAGDAVLVDMGKYLRETFRGEDIVCRYGGEEFVIILPGAGIKECAERAEALRQTVETKIKPVYADKTIGFTVSAGVAVFTGSETTLQRVLEAADQALYKAKSEGRNRVVCAGNAHVIES